MTTDAYEEAIKSQRNLVLALSQTDIDKLLKELLKTPNSLCITAKSKCLSEENPTLPSKLDLLVIDNLQLLSNRQHGCRLDLLMAHLKMTFPRLRIIALSPVGVGNAAEVTQWLHHSDGKPAKYVALDTIKRTNVKIMGRPYAKSPFLFESQLDKVIPEVLLSGGPGIVVCSTRKSCESGALFSRDGHQVVTHDFTLDDGKLSEMIKHGVAYFHAGVSQKDRGIIERLFAENKLRAIFMTLTFALSFRPPVQHIYIKGTNMYDLKEKRYVEYPTADLLQLATKAQEKLVVLTEESKVFKFKNIFNQELCIRSTLQENLEEAVVRAIALGHKTKASLSAWYQETFPPSGKKRDLGTIVERMHTDGLLQSHQVNPFAYVLLKWGIPISSFALVQQLNQEAYDSLGEYIWACAAILSHSSWGLRVNQGDKKVMHKLESLVRYPLPAKAKLQDELPSKLFLFLQMHFDCLEDPAEASFSIKNDVVHLCKQFEHLLECVLESEDRNTFTFELLMCVKNGSWASGPGSLQRHVKGLGVAYSRTLCDRGINTLQKLRHTDARRIEVLLRRQMPFGDSIINQLKECPSIEEDDDIVRVVAKGFHYRAALANGQLERLAEDKAFRKSDVTAIAFENFPIRLISTACCAPPPSKKPKMTIAVPIEPPVSNIARSPTIEERSEPTPIQNYTITENRGSKLDVIKECSHTCKNKLLCKHACCKRTYEPALVFSSQERTIPRDIDSTLEWLRHYRFASSTNESESHQPAAAEYRITFYNNNNN